MTFIIRITLKQLFPGECEEDVYMTNKKGNLNLEILKIYKNVSVTLLDLVKRMLEPNPISRLSIDDALEH